MRLMALRIKNFRGIKRLDLDELKVLIGETIPARSPRELTDIM